MIARPRGIRSRLLLATVLSVGATMCVLVIGFNLLFAHRLDADATDRARARATAQLPALTTSHGQLAVGEAPDAAVGDTPIWIFAGDQALESPRVDPALTAAAHSLARGSSHTTDVPGTDVRLYAAPVVRNGRRLGTVVAGVSLAAYEQAQQTALVASIVLCLLLLAVIAAVAGWILSRALRPVSTMTASARTWSEHDLDHRFNQGPPHDELTELADTLDQLLERTADALRREQRLSAEISHELRTPLARIATEAELGLRRDRTMEEYRHALAAIERNVRAMTRIIDALLGAARAAVGDRRGSCSALQVVDRVVETTAEVAKARGVTVTTQIATPDLKVSADLELACRILQPVVDNACRYGRSTVTVAAERDRHEVRFMICDDGAGVPGAECERIFQPGIRGGGAAAEPAGAGLGLPLARRLAESIGGTITAAPGPGGRFVVRLPAVR